jgi:hypothetical protein
LVDGLLISTLVVTACGDDGGSSVDELGIDELDR